MSAKGETVASMVAAYEEHGCSSVALREVPLDEVSSYGCAAVEPIREGLVRIPHIVEKSDPSEATSNLVVMGRYLFTPDIFGHLHNTAPGVGNEIQLTDAMAQIALGPARTFESSSSESSEHDQVDGIANLDSVAIGNDRQGVCCSHCRELM